MNSFPPLSSGTGTGIGIGIGIGAGAGAGAGAVDMSSSGHVVADHNAILPSPPIAQANNDYIHANTFLELSSSILIQTKHNEKKFTQYSGEILKLIRDQKTIQENQERILRNQEIYQKFCQNLKLSQENLIDHINKLNEHNETINDNLRKYQFIQQEQINDRIKINQLQINREEDLMLLKLTINNVDNLIKKQPDESIINNSEFGVHVLPESIIHSTLNDDTFQINKVINDIKPQTIEPEPQQSIKNAEVDIVCSKVKSRIEYMNRNEKFQDFIFESKTIDNRYVDIDETTEQFKDSSDLYKNNYIKKEHVDKQNEENDDIDDYIASGTPESIQHQLEDDIEDDIEEDEYIEDCSDKQESNKKKTLPSKKLTTPKKLTKITSNNDKESKNGKESRKRQENNKQN